MMYAAYDNQGTLVHLFDSKKARNAWVKAKYGRETATQSDPAIKAAVRGERDNLPNAGNWTTHYAADA